MLVSMFIVIVFIVIMVMVMSVHLMIVLTFALMFVQSRPPRIMLKYELFYV